MPTRSTKTHIWISDNFWIFTINLHRQFWIFDMVNDDGLVQELQTLNLRQPKEEQHDRSYLASKVASKICEHQSMAQSRKYHPMILSPHAIAHMDPRCTKGTSTSDDLFKELLYIEWQTIGPHHVQFSRTHLSLCQPVFTTTTSQKDIVLRARTAGT